VPAIPGLRYQPHFLTTAEELALLGVIRGFALKEAQYRQWQANRRIVSFGGEYDFSANELLPAQPIPPSLFELRAQAAAWCGIDSLKFTHALIAEYQPRTQLGWHRDVPNFEAVVGISLAGSARMRFRPHRPRGATRRAAFALDLAPRSIYTLQGIARWQWQHAVSPTKALRYSITFRTLSTQKRRGSFRQR
jgi:alkylated DNA repair dioxygenase AlkB